MAGSSADRVIEWEGSSLSELVSFLQAAALPVRIEVIAPGTTDSNAGEVHLLAGGLADAFAGSLRRDDAMAALQRLEGARFLVESRLPNPETGSLSEPGPQQGSLKERPLAALMRYCEDYVLTCGLQVARGQEQAVISYRRGEIVSTTVGGSDGSERLPEVLAWTEGSYEIALEAPALPPTPGKKKDVSAVLGRPAERKRHTTLPLGPGGTASGEASAKTASTPPPVQPLRGASSTPPPIQPMRAASSTTPAPRPPSVLAGPPAAGKPITAPGPAVAKPGAAQPPQAAAPTPAGSATAAKAAAPAPAGSATAAKAAAPAPAGSAAAPTQPARPPAQTATQPAPARPVAQVPGPKPPVLAGAGRAAPVEPGKPVAARPAADPAQKPAVRRMTPVPPGKTPVVPVPIAQLSPEMTARGTPPVPAVPLVPAPVAQAPRTAAPAAPVAPAPATAVAKPAAPAPAAAVTKPIAPAVASNAKPVAPAPVQAAGRPVPAGGNAAKPIASPGAKAAEPAPKSTAAQAQVVATAEPVPTVPQARPGKSAAPAASNDLLPASGTIEAKPKHAHQLPPTVAPIEVSAESVVAPMQPASTPVVVPTRAPTPRRPHRVRKGALEQPLKFYVLIGLAIGAGVVITYWAYWWYLPFGRR